MQDRSERARYEIFERLWETEQAISNRVRIFSVGVLAVAWGLLLQETTTVNDSLFDLRLVLGAAVLSVVSLVLDFVYFTLRRAALANAARRDVYAIDGSGPAAPLARMTGLFRAIAFFAAAGVLVYSAVVALLPVVLASGG